jgi:hypothetical protein
MLDRVALHLPTGHRNRHHGRHARLAMMRASLAMSM